ncbi:hypothetical protein RLIN73S_05247 [Rhodanobacter lindaniclasticus]
MHAVEHAGQVDPDDPVPGLERNVGCGRQVVADARVVDRDIEAAVLGLGAGHEFQVIRGVGDVALDEDRIAAGRAQGVERLLPALGGNVGEHELGALARKGQRDAPAQAGTRARDNGRLVLQNHDPSSCS